MMKNKQLILTTSLTLVLLSASAGAAKFDPSESLVSFQPELTEEFKGMLRNADLQAGGEFYERKCATCHDQRKGGIHNKGPLLWNLFGRKAGSEPGFEYSEAMKTSGHTWNFATLNYYLTRTDRAVPGRSMNFRGIRKDQRRANLLAWLRQFNENPPALPE